MKILNGVKTSALKWCPAMPVIRYNFQNNLINRHKGKFKNVNIFFKKFKNVWSKNAQFTLFWTKGDFPQKIKNRKILMSQSCETCYKWIDRQRYWADFIWLSYSARGLIITSTSLNSKVFQKKILTLLKLFYLKATFF